MKLLRVLDQHQQREMENGLEQHKEATQKQVKERHLKKFERLILENESQIKSRKTLHNYSDRPFDKIEEEVLPLGLNFSLFCSSLPIHDIIAKTEAVARSINSPRAQELRSRVKWCLKHAKPPQPNITRQQRTAILRLKREDSIKILPAEKGKSTVIINTTEYDSKMKKLLMENTYEELRKNPTCKIEREFNNSMKNVEEKGFIDRQTRLRLAPAHCQPPRIYGLPKIHKHDRPLRPIISSINKNNDNNNNYYYYNINDNNN